MFRDPRYLAPLGVLLGVILLSSVLAQRATGHSAAAIEPSATAAAGEGAAGPGATSTPDGAAIDAARLQDLVKVRNALLAYRRLNGRFPVTKNGVTTICTAPSDPGCVLATQPGAVPFADGDLPYWFLSDGARVVLIAPAQSASDLADCPPVLPPQLSGKPLICLKFDRPAQ
jgi:hypothetical protein